MIFRTELIPASAPIRIRFSDKLLLIGSCFTENIGSWLEAHFFDVVVNPAGIVYNPASAAETLLHLIDQKQYTRQDLFETNGVHHSYDHHSRFSMSSADEMLASIDTAQSRARAHLLQSRFLLITFGTAWVYELKETGRVVSNCHKQPERLFTRRRMSVDEIVDIWRPLITRLQALNPDLQLVFTVSPIRHIKDTLHGNQLSKSTLLLAADHLCSEFEACSYFEAYEMMLDDLRDYRFYAEDMVHPSDTAIKYIRSKFAETYFAPETQKIVSECEKLLKAWNHRPQHPNSPTYRRFLTQNIETIEHLIKKNHFFTLEKLLLQFKDRLSHLDSPDL